MPTYSHRIDLTRTIVGIIGNVLSFVLFISPVETFWKVLKNKSVEEFHFYPYVATILNCLLWIFYGTPFIHPHSTLIITINGVGPTTRTGILYFLAGEVVLVVGLGLIAMLRFHSHTSRSNFIGGFCTFFGIIMYGSPLTVMLKVIKTRSVEFMPFSFSLAGFLNGICWTAYALLEFDLYVLIGNGVGAFLGLLQLILYGVYFRSTPKKGERAADTPSQVI